MARLEAGKGRVGSGPVGSGRVGEWLVRYSRYKSHIRRSRSLKSHMSETDVGH